MKVSLVTFVVIVFFTACNGQSSSLKKANEVKDAVVAARPGTVPTSKTGWMMTADINGKPWTATAMMPPSVAGRIIGYYREAYIGMPYYESSMVAGKKMAITEDNVVDLSLGHDPDFWTGKSGEMEITEVNGDWVAGTFHFTATVNNKSNKIEVTNGSFRISTK